MTDQQLQRGIRLIRKITIRDQQIATKQYVNYDLMPPGTYDKDQSADLRKPATQIRRETTTLYDKIAAEINSVDDFRAKTSNGPHDSSECICIELQITDMHADRVLKMYTAPDQYNGSSWLYEVYDEEVNRVATGKIGILIGGEAFLIADKIIAETQKF